MGNVIHLHFKQKMVHFHDKYMISDIYIPCITFLFLFFFLAKGTNSKVHLPLNTVEAYVDYIRNIHSLGQFFLANNGSILVLDPS